MGTRGPQQVPPLCSRPVKVFTKVPVTSVLHAGEGTWGEQDGGRTPQVFERAFWREVGLVDGWGSESRRAWGTMDHRMVLGC